MRSYALRGAGSVRRLLNGPRLTGIVCFLAFVSVTNALIGALRLISTNGSPRVRGLVISVALTALLCVWAVWRLRSEWRSGSGPLAPSEARRPRRDAGPATARSRWLRRSRYLVAACLLALGVVAVASQWGTFETALGYLRHVHWRTLRWSILAEGLALVAFAQLTRLLLRTGGVNVGLGSMFGLTLASNAMALTLPAGPAWAASFSVGALRRRGIRTALTAYALIVTWILSAFALVAIALIGIDLAGDSGPAASLRVIATTALIAGSLLVAGIVVLARMRRLHPGVARGVDRLCASLRWRSLGTRLRAGHQELRDVRLTAPLALRCVAAAMLNWIYDCAALVFAILAVGGHVPWQGVLAAYGLTQLAAALPVTPGGVGVVEGTLSILLIAYHVPAATAIAAVMLYRLISFWLVVPLGWGAVAALARVERHRVAKAPLATPQTARAQVTT